MSWCMKGFILLILTVLPTMGVLSLLLFVTWIPPDWIGGTLLVSGLVFLIGAAVLMSSKNIRLWGYSLLAGFLVGAGCMVTATLQLLLLIPVPVFGNALYAVIVLVAGTIFALGLLWPVKESPNRTDYNSIQDVKSEARIRDWTSRPKGGNDTCDWAH